MTSLAQVTASILGAMLVMSAASAQAAPPLAAAPESLPPTSSPPPPYGNSSMRIAGIVITSLGIASVPIGLGLLLAPDPSAQCTDFCLPPQNFAGLMIASLGTTILPAIGIPLWVNGAKPTKPSTRAALASWSLLPLTLPPLHGSSARAAAPEGLRWIGAF